jgi:hypothetical protein
MVLPTLSGTLAVRFETKAVHSSSRSWAELPKPMRWRRGRRRTISARQPQLNF